MYLSVIIPAYNEEKRIGKTLESIIQYLKKQSFDSEIIVVSNNSKDKTIEVSESFQNDFPNLRVLNEPKQGKGLAVKKGMLEAKGELRIFTDADNATSIDQIEKFLPYIDQGFDVVIGSIAVSGAQILKGGEEPLWRVIFGKMGNKWIQIFAGLWGIKDTQRGFKLFTARAAEKIFYKVSIFSWGFDVEVLALAKKFGFKIKEAPVIWSNDPDSKVNIWAYPKVLMQTLKVRLNLMSGVYGK